MNNERMLAYQMAQKLDQDEIQNVTGSIYGQPSGPETTNRCGYPCDIEAGWDF